MQSPPRLVHYQYCYCEESVYRFLDALAPDQTRTRFALFVSNEAKTVHFQCHRGGGGKKGVVWDYHVVAVVREGDRCFVFDHSIEDPDAWPLSLADWQQRCFDTNRVPKRYWPIFRIVPFAVMQQHFSSDRSHMAQSSAPVPPYPPIVRDETVGSNLFSHFVEMKPSSGYGHVKALKLSASDFV